MTGDHGYADSMEDAMQFIVQIHKGDWQNRSRASLTFYVRCDHRLNRVLERERPPYYTEDVVALFKRIFIKGFEQRNSWQGETWTPQQYLDCLFNAEEQDDIFEMLEEEGWSLEPSDSYPCVKAIRISNAEILSSVDPHTDHDTYVWPSPHTCWYGEKGGSHLRCDPAIFG
jgi:hypothetical protein